SGSGGSGGRTGGTGGTGGGQGGAGSGGAGSGGMPPTGGSSGMPSTVCDRCVFDAATTDPHGSLACEDNVCKLRCDTGHADLDKQIANGCEQHLFQWKPSNFDPNASALLAAISDTLTINCSGSLDLGGTIQPSVQICGQTLKPVMLTQANGGPELVAIALRGLSVTSGSKFSFAGSRPVLLAVYGDATIEGELDVSATGTTGAAGSNTGCGMGTGLGGPGVDASDASGGGGGGFGTKGGNGGKGDSSGMAGGVGGVASAETTLSPLRGGCSGGSGGQSVTSRASAGMGGGALQISAAGVLRVSGVIAAAGGGGKAAVGDGDAGGGGGSGGAILLEGTQIVQTSAGWLTANGGGGGDGRGLTAGNPGSDGAHASNTPAAGGGGYSTGAPGAAGEQAAGSPAACVLIYDCGGGGGGGGTGRIVLRADSCTLEGGRSPSAMCMPHQN
ncbi:MAG TPA: hypothetical protein VJR89_39410, partial [Polyangiales bacterium]|nr:hypothetical protein [Polyangiales bacterium]